MDTIQIYGCSSRINGIRDSVASLLQCSSSIGINRFPESFPDVDYWLFVDSAVASRMINAGVYRGQKIITCRHIYDFWFKNRPEFNVYTVFEPNDAGLKIGNSAYYALEWAIRQGYKKAVLYGILDEQEYTITPQDGVEFKHFYGEHGYFPAYKWEDFTKAIGTGLNGRIEISRPLL